MSGDPTQSATALLIQEFGRRFPLIKRVVGEFGDIGQRERIPWLFAYLLAAAENPSPGGYCFVLDTTPGTAVLAAVLTAFSRLKAEFPRLVEDYAKNAFTLGQRVRVLPSDAVFEYGGLWDEFPGQFKLKLLGADTRSIRSFPLEDVLRLEPTDRIRPRGTGATKLGQRASGPLDQLLDISSCGNNSIIRNSIICHMPRRQFARVTELAALASATADAVEKLSLFLPWGSIDAEGSLHPNDLHQTVGEPLVAVSGSPDDIARHCKDSPAGKKIVFADGAQRFSRDLQAYDDIVAKQKLILLAAPNETDDLQVLSDRGCAIWRMSSDEMLLGEDPSANRPRKSLVGGTIRAADIRMRTSITSVDCSDEDIEAVAKGLERVSASLEPDEEAAELDETLGRLFRILFECSECCFGPPVTAAESIEAARKVINRNARWLPPDGVASLATAMQGLEAIITSPAMTEKARLIVDLLTDRMLNKGEAWSVLGRSSLICHSIADGLRQHGLDPVVSSVSSITAESEFDGIVLLGWPNDARFRHLLGLAVAPEIRVLTYEFEKKWFQRFRAKAAQRAALGSIPANERAQIIRVPETLLPRNEPRDPFTESQTPESDVLELPVFKFEDRIARRRTSSIELSDSSHELRSARLVTFTGGCHAFMTEWAEHPILNDIIEHGFEGKGRIERKTVDDLLPGDFLLFRAAGDKEFIRLIAEETMGEDEYARQRGISERWKEALHVLGSSPAAVQRRLAEFGLHRTTVTVGAWLGDPNKIGPGNDSDIEILAKAAGDEELLASLDQVASAISTIRSAHLGAGMHLTKLILGELRDRIHEIREEPTLLDLGYGEAWVVQVRTVDTESIDCPSNKTNRILWDADTGF